MKFLQAKQTARRLFPGEIKLIRNKHNRCFVIQDGKPVGDGTSWLEALRSAGEFHMLKNDLEAKRVKVMVDEYQKLTGVDTSKPLTTEQLTAFDEWVASRENE